MCKRQYSPLLNFALAAVVGIFLSARIAEADLDSSLQVVDLRDLTGSLPLGVNSTTQILWQTQDWEHGSFGNPSWPAGGGDSVGYPSVVKNSHGLNPDGKYYLYYAHHDPLSGIGCAVADNIGGPYTKVAVGHQVLGVWWTDSQVLVNPNYRPATLGGPHPDGVAHFSSPSVVWNEDEGLWFMYFHYFNHYWGGAGGDPWNLNNPGYGHQMTALATSPSLSSHNWTIWTDPVWAGVSVWDIVPVLPTTDASWMESQSSYHAIQRLPDGTWLAFMRGTNNTTGLPTVGFGTSSNGRTWSYFPENPVIASGKAWTVSTSEYRPKFIGYLGGGEYLAAWSEHSNPNIIYGTTTDFKTFTRDARGYATWGVGDDGIVSVFRESDRLYLFSGKHLHVMNLTVHTTGDITGNGLINFNDLLILLEQWLETPGDPSADIAPQPGGDNEVNLLDFSLLSVDYQPFDPSADLIEDFEGNPDITAPPWSQTYGGAVVGTPNPGNPNSGNLSMNFTDFRIQHLDVTHASVDRELAKGYVEFDYYHGVGWNRIHLRNATGWNIAWLNIWGNGGGVGSDYEMSFMDTVFVPNHQANDMIAPSSWNRIRIDWDTSTQLLSLALNGVPVPGMQNVPGMEPGITGGNTLTRVDFYDYSGTTPDPMQIDNIRIGEE
jgi:hypothetical protein